MKSKSLLAVDRRVFIAGSAAALALAGTVLTRKILKVVSRRNHATQPDADIVLSGERLNRFAEMKSLLRDKRPDALQLHLDPADEVLFAVALDTAGARVTRADGHDYKLGYYGRTVA